MVVVVTVPDVGVKLTELANPLAELVETTTPVGAVTTKLFVAKFEPETLKL
jgi:hypothetical protein